MALHQDSTLVFYSESDATSPDFGVRLRDAPEMIAVGQVGKIEIFISFIIQFSMQYTSQVPNRPEFPEDVSNLRTALAIGSRSSKEISWFIVETEEGLM